MLTFLIDECLTPRLARIAHDAGHLGAHVRDLGLTRAPDHRVAAAALDHDMVVVTNNGRDFIRLLEREDIHPGLVGILPTIRRDRQMALFGQVLKHIEGVPDLINTLVEIDANGTVTLRDFPEI